MQLLVYQVDTKAPDRNAVLRILLTKECRQKHKIQNLRCPDRCGISRKSIRPPVAFGNTCVYRGFSTGGLVRRPPIDLPSELPSAPPASGMKRNHFVVDHIRLHIIYNSDYPKREIMGGVTGGLGTKISTSLKLLNVGLNSTFFVTLTSSKVVLFLRPYGSKRFAITKILK